MKMYKKNKITAHVFGEISVDIKHFIENSKESYKWVIQKDERLLGGMGANISVLLKLFEIETCLYSIMDDEYLEVVGKLKRFGVNYIPIVKGRFSKIYNIFFSGDDRRVISIKNGDFLKKFELTLDVNKECDILVVSPIFYKHASRIPELYSTKTLKVLVPALEFVDMPINDFGELINKYNLIVLDRIEAEQYCSSDHNGAIEWFKKNHHDICVVITNGKKDIIVTYRGKLWKHSVYEEADNYLVDTMGCGDAFSAAFSFYFLQTSGDIRYALNKASEYSWMIGTIQGMFCSFIESENKIINYIAKMEGNHGSDRI